MNWEENPGEPGIQAPLSYCGPYVISHRFAHHTLSYRPPGEHHHLGAFATAEEAKAAAEAHLKGKGE